MRKMLRSIGHLAATAVVMAGVSGCSKEASVAPGVADALVIEDDIRPKVLPYFLNSFNLQQNNYSVVELGGNCVIPWGSLPYGNAPSSLVLTGSPSYVRVTDGSCPIDPNYMRFKRGSTVGSYGPYYVLTPANGPANKLRLKLRVKNVAAPPLDYYEGKFVYNSATNTWTSSSSTDAYQWTTVTTIPTAICPPR